jgi:hypothetical protein
VYVISKKEFVITTNFSDSMKITRRILILLLILSFFCMQTVFAQIIAGVIPNGVSTVNPKVNLSASACFTSDSVAFSIDCSGTPDMALKIYKDATSIDGRNYATLYIIKDTISICYDTGSFNGPHYYNYGDTLNCVGSRKLLTDSTYQLGDNGCMLCFGPASENNVYLEYIKGTQIGWLEISFNLSDGGSCTQPITLTSSSAVSFCITGFEEITNEKKFYVSPNPTTNGKFTINSSSNTVSSIEIFNLIGESIFKTSTKNVMMPYQANLTGFSKGIYFIKIFDGVGTYNKKISFQ